MLVMAVGSGYAAINTQGSINLALDQVENKNYALAKLGLQKVINDDLKGSTFNKVHLALGKCYYFENDFENAANEFELVADSFLDESLKDEANYLLGETSYKKKNYSKAREYYELVSQAFPTSRFAVLANYSKAWCAYDEGDYKDALNLFKGFLNKYPGDKIAQEAMFMTSLADYELCNYYSAKLTLKEFIEKYPLSKRLSQSYYLLGEIENKLDNPDESITYFNRSLEIDSMSAWSSFAYKNLALANFAVGNYSDALKNFTKARSLATGEVLKLEAIIGEAISKVKLDGSGNADEMLSALIKEIDGSNLISPEERYLLKGIALTSFDRLDKALEIYNDAINKFSTLNELYDFRYNLGRLYVKLNDPDNAIRQFEDIYRSNSSEYVKGGMLLEIARLKSDKEALKFYDKILKLYPDSGFADTAQYNVAKILLEQGDYDSSQMAFRSLAVNFPDSRYLIDAEFNIAQTFKKKGDYESAGAVLKNILERYSNSDINLKAAIFYKEIGMFSEAIPILIKLKSNRNLNEIVSYELAYSYYASGDTENSLNEFKEFLKKFKDSPLSTNVNLWLADYYFNKGQYDVAKSLSNKIVGQSSDAHYILASILLAQNKTSDAKREFGLVRPEKNSFYYKKAILKLASVAETEHNDEEAFNNYSKLCSDSDPEISKMAYRKMAEISKRTYKYDEAIDYYLKAISDKDHDLNAQIQYQIAEVFVLNNDPEQALMEFKRVTQLYPESKFWVIKSFIESAKICERLKKYELAKEIYTALADYDADSSKFAMTKVAIYNNFLNNR